MKLNIAIFASGGGTNCENLIRYFADSAMVSTPLVVSKAELNDAAVMLPLLRRYDIQFIVLAGFLPLIPDFLVEAYPRRIVNIHPSLLPKYGGKGMWGHHVHEAVKAAGETETGMTVHWVSSVCDSGEIIAQYRVALSPSDMPDDIAAKEHVLEMTYYPQVIENLVRELDPISASL